MRRVTIAAVLLAIAPAVAAQDADTPPQRSWRLFGSTHTFFEDNRTAELRGEDTDYQKFKQLFSLNLAWSKISAGAQLEYLWYSDPELVDPGDLDRLREGVELRKYWVEYLGDKLQGRLGTFFTSFGLGMTLFVQKNEEIGLDEPVHGATATAHLGRFELTALGGRVTDPLLEDQYNRRFEDIVRGARAVVRLPYELYVGGSYVAADLESTQPDAGDDVADVWSIEAGGYSLGGYLDIAGEWSEIEKFERGRTKEGYGRYLSLSSSIGPITLLGEVKDYWNFEWRYNNPPTAGPSEEAYDHNDVKGPRLLVSGDIMATGTILWASYAQFDTHRQQEGSIGGLEGDEQIEWLVALEETLDPIYLEASYFNRDWVNRGIIEEHIIANLHVTTLAGRGDVSMGYDVRKERADYFSLADHRSYLAFSLSSYGSISARYSWKERSQQSTEDFWGGEIEYFPIRAITCGLFVGSDPGGLVCSGGQCREEPPFKGVKARFTWRF